MKETTVVYGDVVLDLKCVFTEKLQFKTFLDTFILYFDLKKKCVYLHQIVKKIYLYLCL